jgi:hypothetical protein
MEARIRRWTIALVMGAPLATAASAADCGAVSGGAEPIECRAPAAWRAAWPAVAASPLAPTDFAWSSDFFTGDLGSYPLDDFPAFLDVGTHALDLFALDFDPSATTLYGLDSASHQFGTLSLADAGFTPIGASAPTEAGQNLWSGLSIDPRTGTIYASAIAGTVDVPYGLYTIDPATGNPTHLGGSATTMAMIDIAIDCQGAMYGHDIIADAIYAIDPADGSVTLVGPTGVSSNFAQGLDFDNEAGVLYAWTYQGGGANQYGTIDLVTGNLTPLSASNPIGEWEGTVRNTCPEPVFDDDFESGDTSAWDEVVAAQP